MINKTKEMLATLAAIFFISGFSALIYQVCWQRLLFTGFGVDLTSITVIVSIFMAGLGVGAYFGGRIADKFGPHLLIVFCLVELGIGCFGLVSASLINFTQHVFINSSLFTLSVITFLLLIFPTFLMGATLPVLTSFFNRYIANVGESIGTLYFYNTLGAAAGALTTGFILFNYLTLSQTIYFAASLNIFIAIVIFATYGRKKYEE
ncbi:MAG: fused MFS/spermidine synthase [Acinetobacter sp.]